MDKIKKIELNKEQLVDISNEMHFLTDGEDSQGWFEWLLLRSISNVLRIDLFKEMYNDNESDDFEEFREDYDE